MRKVCSIKEKMGKINIFHTQWTALILLKVKERIDYILFFFSGKLSEHNFTTIIWNLQILADFLDTCNLENKNV